MICKASLAFIYHRLKYTDTLYYGQLRYRYQYYLDAAQAIASVYSKCYRVGWPIPGTKGIYRIVTLRCNATILAYTEAIASEAIIVTNSFSCHHQIHDLSARRPIHLAETVRVCTQ